MTHSGVRGAELSASIELSRGLIEVMPGGVVQVDIEGRLVQANAEALRIVGLDRDDFARLYRADAPFDTVWEDGSRCGPEDYPLLRALRTGQRQSEVVIGVRTAQGALVWTLNSAAPLFGSDGAVVGAVVAFVDITRQRNAEQALKESEARLRSVLESVPGYVILVDRELQIRYCSGFVVGVQASQIIGHSALEFAREGDRDSFRARLLQVFESSQATTFELVSADWLGHATYRISAGPLLDGGQVEGVTMIAEDITKQKEMEARLMLSERLASVGTLAAGVAHEINNPLTYVLGNLELLDRQLPERSELRSRIAEAMEGSERISAVVRDLMGFSHRDDNQNVPVRVSAVIDRAVRMANHEIQRRARLVRGTSDVPDVVGSAARVGQVLLNLLINAAHAIPSGSRDQNEIGVSASLLSPDVVRVSVSDTGRGIERALLGRIFDPFITTKPLGEGTGLGLYVCHNIVTSLGGAIWVDSQVGRGSTFHVDLPVYRAEHKSSSPSSSRPSRVPSSRLRLLVVDDEPSIAAFIRHALATHEVATVSCGRDAIAALEARTFDVVLCDVVMPDLTGLQVYRHAQQRIPELASRFLFISGGALGDLAPEVRDAGVPILYKPFGLRELHDAMAQLTVPT